MKFGFPGFYLFLPCITGVQLGSRHYFSTNRLQVFQLTSKTTPFLNPLRQKKKTLKKNVGTGKYHDAIIDNLI